MTGALLGIIAYAIAITGEHLCNPYREANYPAVFFWLIIAASAGQLVQNTLEYFL